jgi:hypothetical protein
MRTKISLTGLQRLFISNRVQSFHFTAWAEVFLVFVELLLKVLAQYFSKCRCGLSHIVDVLAE